MIFNIKVELTIQGKKPQTIFYSFNEYSTFEDLLEYIIYLFQDKTICHCFSFSYNIHIFRKVNIISLKNNIFEFYKSKDSNTLYLSLSKIRQDCNCNKYLYFKSKKDIFDNFVNSYKNLEIQKEDEVKKFNQLKQENIDIQNQLSSLKTENTNQKNEINALEKNKRNMDKKNKLLEVAVNGDYDKIVFLNKHGIIGNTLKMKENTIKIDPKTNQFIGNETSTDKKFIDFYDVIVHINSIKALNTGWKVEINPNGKQNYEQFKNQGILKIGVIGNSNKGKSFLLSKISKIDLPSGTSIRTEGLSIKYPNLEGFENRKIVLLDSAGLETPVLQLETTVNDKKKFFKEQSREKLITELFLQNYIINNSNVLIAVVGILTYSEQKLIMKIKKEMERAKIEIPLFIIHNLIPYTEVEQVNKYIEKFLLKSATFNLIEGHKISTQSTQTKDQKGRYFYEESENQKIYHLIYANEGSKAGEFFNKFTLDFLENNYQTVTHLKPFDVIETIKERFIQLSNDIIEKTGEEKFDLNSFDDSNSDVLKLKDIKEIKLKKCLTDELGFSNLKANGFEPLYNLYKKNDDLIIIRVEAPGNCNLAPPIIEPAGEYNIIKISGEKKKDKEPQDINDNLFNTREIGKFSFDIPLKAEEYFLSNKKPTINQKNGIFIIECQLDKKVTTEGFQMKEEDEI